MQKYVWLNGSLQATSFNLAIFSENRKNSCRITCLPYILQGSFIRDGVEDTRLEIKAKSKATKNFEAKGRPSRGQGQGPRTKDTNASVLQKKVFKNSFQAISKKRSSKNFFRRKRSSKNFFSGDFYSSKTKKGLRKFSARYLALSNKISTVQKIVLSSSRGQGNFRGLEASRPRPRTSKCVLEDSTSVFYTASFTAFCIDF